MCLWNQLIAVFVTNDTCLYLPSLFHPTFAQSLSDIKLLGTLV